MLILKKIFAYLHFQKYFILFIGILFLLGLLLIYVKIFYPSINESRFLHKALYYRPITKQKVQCTLCPKFCVLNNKQTGSCLIRRNINGTLYTIDFGNVVLDQDNYLDLSQCPITLLWTPRLNVLGLSGCALNCAFCFVGEAIQSNPEKYERIYYYSPEDVIKEAKLRELKYISFSNNEPLISYEYTLEVAKLAKENKMKVMISTAGYVNQKPFEELLKYVDVVAFSLKGFSQKSYQKYTSGNFDIVLSNLRELKNHNIKFGIVYLIIPTISDDEKEIRAMAKWVRTNLGEYTPVHFMRYVPAFKLRNLPATPLSTIRKAMTIASEEGLKYIIPYANFGDYDIHELIAADLTYLRCPYCGNIVAKYSLNKNNEPILIQHLRGNHACGFCGKYFFTF